MTVTKRNFKKGCPIHRALSMKYKYKQILTTSHVVIMVLRIAQLLLLLLFLFFSIFLINDIISLFSIDMSYSHHRMAISKVEGQIMSMWAWFFGRGGDEIRKC